MTEPHASACWSCGATGLVPFFESRSIPTSSCVLLPSRQEAEAWPVGDLRLAFCPACGFIQNELFNPDLIDYTQPYEESQAFSATFSRFATRLANRLIDSYGIRHKEVFEIGCGKGDFLKMVCELGDNRGLGIDPAFTEGRLETTADVRVLNEFFSERTTQLTGDLITCVHTLEHIQAVGNFVHLIRQSAEHRAGSVVFIEVPDTMRILMEGAFWDIYYEHCSYFTLGSLGRLLRASGFHLLSLETGYDDQYLLVEATAPSSGPDAHFPGEDDLDQIAKRVRVFSDAAYAAIRSWERRLEDAEAAGRRVVVWGASSKGVSFLTTLKAGRMVSHVVDINPYKQGKFMPGTGQEIIAPESLTTSPPDLVIVMNPIYLEEIGADLTRLGLAPEVVAV
ncbi:MAG: methyltransferase domain-containing protein [Gammaproteobacteria bacterium]|nr:methyltransferase domain-containing protein [Gammaproteobacteria bacterium]